MNIGIDITSALNQTAGIGRYTKQLVKNLIEIDSNNQYIFYSFFGDTKDESAFANKQVITRFRNYPSQSFKTLLFALKTLRIPTDFLVSEANVVHLPDFVLPAPNKPTVLTVPDLTFIRYPEYYTLKNRLYMKSVAAHSINKAKAIITYSKATKNDLVEIFGVANNKITSIYLGVDEHFKPSTDKEIENIKNKYKLPDRYILSLGTIEPRKNYNRLLGAYLKLKKNTADNTSLVIAGKKGWHCKNFLEKLDNAGKNVIWLNFVDEADLPALYTSASVFVYPSLYEGFGLPPLEAMACGTPVVCSNTSSLPEVVGDAALQVDPYKTGEIAEAVYKILDGKELADKLSKKGIDRAKQFSWKKTAEQTLEVYKSIGQ
ncbi:MAG: glycosyltransferase family 1 protein [Actinobacteria bacterium]|nr:MAG: glycosyltransferase family 1 protein [Actinomycetota bacterium]